MPIENLQVDESSNCSLSTDSVSTVNLANQPMSATNPNINSLHQVVTNGPVENTVSGAIVSSDSVVDSKGEEQDESKQEEVIIPDSYKCPITKELMIEPVINSAGQTYERAAITQWFQRSSNDPITGIKVSNKTLYPNHFAKSLIIDWAEQNNYSISKPVKIPEPEGRSVTYDSLLGILQAIPAGSPLLRFTTELTTEEAILAIQAGAMGGAMYAFIGLEDFNIEDGISVDVLVSRLSLFLQIFHNGFIGATLAAIITTIWGTISPNMVAASPESVETADAISEPTEMEDVGVGNVVATSWPLEQNDEREVQSSVVNTSLVRYALEVMVGSAYESVENWTCKWWRSPENSEQRHSQEFNEQTQVNVSNHSLRV